MKTNFPRSTRLLALATLTGSLLLSACGGGGDGVPPPSTGDASVPAADSRPVISGTAATGAAIVGATVAVLDRSGISACANDPITTNAQGVYSCRLLDSAIAPFIVSVVDPQGLVSPQISIALTRPNANSSATVNVTPLTTGILAQLDPNRNPFALSQSPQGLANINLAELNAIIDNVASQLASVLSSVSPTIGNSTPFPLHLRAVAAQV